MKLSEFKKQIENFESYHFSLDRDMGSSPSDFYSNIEELIEFLKSSQDDVTEYNILDRNLDEAIKIFKKLNYGGVSKLSQQFDDLLEEIDDIECAIDIKKEEYASMSAQKFANVFESLFEKYLETQEKSDYPKLRSQNQQAIFMLENAPLSIREQVQSHVKYLSAFHHGDVNALEEAVKAISNARNTLTH